jgi:hypothetical protein
MVIIIVMNPEDFDPRIYVSNLTENKKFWEAIMAWVPLALREPHRK